MPEFIRGTLDGKGCRIAIVAARWNDFVVEVLLDGALTALRMHGVEDQNVTVLRCPGSYEVPLLVKKCADTKKFDAVIALGAVIRGETFHFELVAIAASEGISRAMLDSGVPCIFGVLTTDTTEQAIARAGEGADNKGFESALAALEMISVLRQLV